MSSNTENFSIGTGNYYVGNGYFRYLSLRNNPSITSDERLKQNIKPIDSSLERILKVNGKSFNYIDDSKDLKITPLKEKITKPTFGFIAQDLKKVFPELVNEPDELSEYYSVDYIAMIPILVEAMKEQQKLIENLQKETEVLKEICIKSTQKSVEINENNVIQQINLTNDYDEDIKVFQNAPNPFTETTTIQCYIPATINKAELCVYDMQGAIIKCNLIYERGNVDV